MTSVASATDYGIGVARNHPDGPIIDVNTNSGAWVRMPKSAFTNCVLWNNFSWDKTTHYDLTVHTNDAVEISDPVHTSVPTVGNAVLWYDDVDDSVDVDSTCGITTLNTGTFACWVKPDTDSNNGVWYFQDTSIGSTYEFFISVGPCTVHLANELVTISTSQGGNHKVGYCTADRSEMFDGGWHHIVVTSDGSEYKIYLDGESKSLTVGAGANDGNWAYHDGGDLTHYIGYPNYMSGYVDIPALWNRCLSPAEVSQLYTNTLTETMGLATAADLASDAALIMHMDYPEDAGIGHDSSTNLNHGTYNGSEEQVIVIADDGSQNGTMGFDGVDDESAHGNIGTVKTISFLMYADDITSREVVDFDGTDKIELNSSSNIVATSFPGATIYTNGVAGSGPLSASIWYHITVTDSTGVSGSGFTLGDAGGNNFDGNLDEVKCWPDVRTGGEITTESAAALALVP